MDTLVTALFALAVISLALVLFPLLADWLNCAARAAAYILFCLGMLR